MVKSVENDIGNVRGVPKFFYFGRRRVFSSNIS